MQRFLFLLPLLFCLLLCTCGRAAATTSAANEPPGLPNILFILTDDQGIGDLSLHGNDSIQTPNMDALLRSSARFSRFYVSPVCAPTRASFLSGMYAPRTGAIFVTRRRETMDNRIMTLPEYLRHAGYRTGLFGKWHNGATAPYDPPAQGFEEFLGFTLGHFNDYFSGTLENERREQVPFAGDLSKILTDSAAHFMQQESRDPFFCMLAYQAPHTPVQVVDKHWDWVQERGLTDYNTGIYAMIESLDEQLGRLLATLEEKGILDNTVVIFSTDNGPNGDRYRMGLKGTKGQVDEGGVRVPFGIKMPGDHPANGKVFDRPSAHIDVVPTLLELADLPVPESLDGRSMLGVLNADPLSEDTGRFIYAFKQGYDFKMWPGSMRNKEYLYVRRSETDHELYDLQADPGQTENIFAINPPIGEQLATEYEHFAKTVYRPDRVAPPIDLGATWDPITLYAHEGEPQGDTHFKDKYGWANDFFVNLGPEGAQWPVKLAKDRTYTLTIHYHLEDKVARTLVLGTDKGQDREVTLPPAITQQLPVADRVPRKEVYPRQWATLEVKDFKVEAETTLFRLFSSDRSPGLWIKEVEFRSRW